MKIPLFHSILVSFGLTLILGSTFSLAINETPAEPTPDAVQTETLSIEEKKIFAVIERGRALKQDLILSEERLRAVAGEERESIMLTRHEKYKALIAELKEFVVLSRAYTTKGGNIQNLLIDFREDLLNTGAGLRSDQDRYLRDFATNGKDRDTQTVAGLKEYVFESRQVDFGFQLLAEYAQVVKSADYSAEPTLKYLLEHLPVRAESLAGRIRLSDERAAEYRKSIALKPDDADAKATLQLVEQKLEMDRQSLQMTIDLAKLQGINMSEYQTLLVKTSGQITSAMFDKDVMGELLREWWLETKHSLGTNIGNLLLKVFVFLLTILVFKAIASAARKILHRSVNSSKVNLSMLMQNMLLSTVSRVIMLMGFLVALAQVGVSLGPVLAGLGVVGFVIGFALQDTLGNFAAGMMILLYRPYDVGDFVEAAGAFGMVKSMNIVSTTILTIDNQTLIIPNSKIWGDVIKNVTAQKERRVDMVFGISYSDNIEKTESILKDIVDRHEKVLSMPEPVIKLHKLGESSVDFVVRPWTKTENYWEVYWDITRAVKMRFDEEGISIPFPQRDVHIYQTEVKPKG